MNESQPETELTSVDATRIRELVGIAARAASRAVLDVTSVPTPESSPAFGQGVELHQVVGADAERMFSESHSSVHLATLAGVDHMKGFAAGVARPGTTVSLATLTRGAVEAFGKAHFLLSAGSGIVLIQRHTAVQEIELKSTGNLTFRDSSGTVIDGEKFLGMMRGRVERLAVGLLKTGRGGLTITGLAWQILEASANISGSQAADLYSQLAAIAHGNTAALAMHVAGVSGPPVLRLPRDLTFENAAMNLGTCVRVIDTYLNVYGAADPTRERWAEAKRLVDPLVRDMQKRESLGG